MGFNIQEYELASKDNYSNAIGFGCELIIRKDKRAACEAARDIRKGNVVAPDVEDEAPKKSISTPTSIDAPMGGTPEAPKSNTAMYIGIGVGVLAIGIVAIILIRRN